MRTNTSETKNHKKINKNKFNEMSEILFSAYINHINSPVPSVAPHTVDW